MRKNYFRLAILAAMALPFISTAQQNQSPDREFYLRPSYWRPYDQRGINAFETTKAPDTIPFEGTRVRLGAGFTQQFQNLKHSNTGAVNYQSTNKLYALTPGFMTSQANLFLDVQLADGIRLNVTTYLSARHHNEAWVKGGYIQFDKLPFKGQFWSDLMKIATIKIGHMEINYGDAHFRRPDGGQTLYNPFMEGNILDAFATEIGGEVYLQHKGLIGMVGLTNGMIKGNVDSVVKTTIADGSTKRSPSIYGKLGIDKNLAERIRVRVTGSLYHNSNSNASGLTLYGGDRTGSNYQNVMEKVPLNSAIPASTSIAFSGRLDPKFSKKVTAAVLNGFLKVGGLEFFGTYEKSKGRTKAETKDRKASQYAGDVIYRFGKTENVFVGFRYNSAKAQLSGIAPEITVNRIAGSAGWFLTRNVLLKAELVQQKYLDFPITDYRAGGKFHGYVIEAVVGF
jgi:hypothetical protein